jgi:hypothetical protein
VQDGKHREPPQGDMPRHKAGATSVFLKTKLPHIEAIVNILNRDHLDGMMFCNVIADPDAEFAPLASIHRDVCRLSLVVIEDGIGLRTKLGTQPATR